VINTSQLQVRTEIDELSQILDWFDQLQQPSIPTAVWLQCQTALAEGFTNAVRHAHKGKSIDTTITIDVTIQAHALEVRIWDQGPAFDLAPAMAAAQQLTDQEAIGGRGLVLLKRMADRVSYIRTPDNRNCLLIIKEYTPLT